MKIIYVPSDMDAPGCYRSLFPGRQLAAHGHDVEIPPYTLKMKGDRYQVAFDVDFELPKSADLYVLQQRKERIWQEQGVAKLRALGMATTADVDDNYVNVPVYNPAFYGTHQYRRDDGVILNRKMRRNLKRETKYIAPPNSSNAHHLHEQLRKVDLVTVSTPHLANTYEPYNKNIKVIRNYLDWDIWKDITPQYEVKRERVRIGYLGVYRYRRDDLKVLGNSVSRLLRAHPEVDFVANSEEVHQFLGVPEGQRITVGEYDFQPIAPAYCDLDKTVHEAQLSGELPVGEMTAVCDIGLVPLVINDLNQSKSHLKGMEYNAAGIPFIASPTESYTDYWCQEGYNGFVASSEDEWYELMRGLAEDPSLRESMGRKGRFKASTHTIQEHYTEWENAYTELVGGKHHEVARRSLSLGGVQKTSELGPFLKLVEDLKPKVVVEIGTASGGTFWAIAQYAADDALLVSIDIPAGSPLDVRQGKDVYVGRDRDRIKHFVRAEQKLRLIDLNSQLPETYATLLAALGGRKIDLLFIDGDHRYEGVKHDYETYSKLVRPGGMIAFHDIEHHWDERVKVDVFWNEIKGSDGIELFGDETWGYNPWGGIGVVYK